MDEGRMKDLGVFFISGVLCYTISQGLGAIMRHRSRKRPRISPTVAESQAVVLKRVPDPDLDARKPPDDWNTAIFFPDPAYPSSPTRQLLDYFENAKVRILMCMYLASLTEIREIVLRKRKQEGLLIQVITDYDTLVSHNNWNAKAYARAGIEVRAKNRGSLMHNKFVIIDDEAVLTGSLNQTKQAVTGNYENVVVTTHKKTVDKFIQEFTDIWITVERVNLSVFR